MSVQFARKLSSIPGYVAGAPAGKAPESIADEGIAQLASNESPYGPASGGRRGDRARRDGHEPLPGPERGPAAPADRRALRARPGRRRGLQRLLRDPACRRPGALRAGGGARLRLAVLFDVPVPGAALGRARDPGAARRLPLARPRGDRDRGHGGDPARADLQPEQPHRHASPGGADRRAVRAHARPRDRDPRRGLRRVPARRRPRCRRRPAAPVPQPGEPAYVQQGLRARRAAGRLRDLLAEVPRRGRRGAPAVQRERDRPGRGGGGDPPRRRRRRPGRAQHRRAGDRAGGRPRPGAAHARLARQLLLGRAAARTPRRATSSPRMAERGILVRAGTPLGGPGHIRVTYGTAEENRRFLAALGEILGR